LYYLTGYLITGITQVGGYLRHGTGAKEDEMHEALGRALAKERILYLRKAVGRHPDRSSPRRATGRPDEEGGGTLGNGDIR
jgi:hypothetical protein